jgi:hypothetical protein
MTTSYRPKHRFFIFFSIVIISCTNSNTKIENTSFKNRITLPYRIDIEKNIKNVNSIPLSFVGKKIEYVALETTPESLLKRITGIQFSEKCIFVSDFDRLLQFDRNGKFIRQVGDNGRGPGEYIHVSDFWIDEKNEKAYVMAWGIKTIKEYDFNGNFIKSFKFAFSSLQFIKTGNNSYTFVIPNAPFDTDSEFRLIVTDSAGTEILKIRNYNRVYNKPPLIAASIPMYYFNDTLRINESRVDTLNSFINGRHKPYVIFKFGIYKMDLDQSIPFEPAAREEVNNRLRDRLWIWTISENNTFLFLKFNIGVSDSSAFGVFNKKKSEIAFLNNGGFDDDLGIGIPFWPKYVYHDSLLIDHQDAYKIMNAKNKVSSTKINDPKYHEIITELNNLEETSNPVLIMLNSDK